LSLAIIISIIVFEGKGSYLFGFKMIKPNIDIKIGAN